MNIRLRAGLALLAAAMLCLLVFISPAGATQGHWTDGTTCQGAYCPPNVPTNPPPKPAHWTDPCKVLAIDPVPYVYVTIHFKTNGVEFASPVVPYTGNAPGFFDVNVALIVDGHKGVVTLTWNIGIGVSAPFSFDCTHPEPTTTTTVAPTTTTTVKPVVSTTTTTEPAGVVTTTTVKPVIAGAISQKSLPNTGAGDTLLVALGLSMVGAGFLLLKNRKGSDQRG